MTMAARTSALLASIALLLWAVPASAEELKSSLERNPIHAGESGRLVLELRRAAGGLKPDLSPLTEEFQILHTSANTQIEFIHGLQSAITRWTVELTPKREGTLTVPSITVGQFASAELSLDVLAPRADDDAGSRDIFLEAEVSPNPAYVQAQMRFVVRLLRSVDVVDGTLTEPSATNAVLRRLGRDISYTTTRDKRSYRVLERRYALFPQASGELVISPVEFEGEVVDAGQAGTGLSRLFARGKRLRLRTDVVRATALPPPAAFAGHTWLPAKSLLINEEWSTDPETLRAGEPVTRTLSLRAVGLSAEQLPEVEVTISDGIKEYADQPITRTTTDTDWVHGVREQRIALVPGGEGTYTLPEIRIDWWDTERDALRQATLPARTLRVAAGAPSSVDARLDADPVPAVQPMAASPWRSAPLWQGVAALLAVIWLLTLVAWCRARAPKPADADRNTGGNTPREPPTSLREACLGDDAPGAREGLLRWAAESWPANPPRSLPALASRLADPALRAEIALLDRALYARSEEDWSGEQLWRSARRGLEAPMPIATAQGDDLPIMYPR
jgi:hypothetical protein